MDLVEQSQPFCFNYTAYDQDTSLFVAGSVFDITTGIPVFISKVTMNQVAYGFYSGNFTAGTNRSYLVISLVYTDGTYTTINTSRSPAARSFQTIQGTLTQWSFNYASADQDVGLDISANVYDMTTGTPVLVDQIALIYVTAGVYFGRFTGISGKTYEINSLVYTDGTYTTVDPDYSPATDSFTTFFIQTGSGSTNTTALLMGQSVNATLIGQNLNAVLLEGQRLQSNLSDQDLDAVLSSQGLNATLIGEC